MPGLDGRTRTYRLSTNVRVAKFSGLISDATDTTQANWFASVPPSATPWLTAPAGLTIGHHIEPNQFYKEDTDPTTITGSTPGGSYTLGGTGVQDNGPGITVQYTGWARCTAAGAITDGAVVVIADQYGRVNTLAGAGIAGGTKVFQLGIFHGKTTAANQIGWVDIVVAQITA